MNEKTITKTEQIVNGCASCLFTMRQKSQSFDKALLVQTQLFD